MKLIDADALKEDLTRFYDNEVTARKLIDEQPTIQPEITHEQAIDYLHSTGWMQEHDRQMMLDGVHRLTVQPEPHWIPVTERLPEASGLYLVTEKWYGERETCTRYYNKRKEGESFWSGHPHQMVHAWMPLPEPYKGVTE